ncbi:hypothetical protein [Hydrogenophaga sp.]|uniref:hypothetical protein n=1 Tax=Hydrogenophaga sp. TaxID=1904254 RepID=UPI003D13B563
MPQVETRMRAGAVVIAWAFALGAGDAQSQPCSTPLPSDVIVATPSATDGPQAFLGVWGDGQWQGVLCHTLVVETLSDDNSVVAVYSHGAYPGWNIRAPGFVRVPGQVRDDTLHIAFPNGSARVEYRIVDGKLQGRYITRSNVATAVLTRK